jgi:hypothetical protein
MVLNVKMVCCFQWRKERVTTIGRLNSPAAKTIKFAGTDINYDAPIVILMQDSWDFQDSQDLLGGRT